MTHPELLEKLQAGKHDYEASLRKSLIAIAELHTYVLTGKKMRGKAGLSKRCTECGFAYPCSTIEIIEKALG